MGTTLTTLAAGGGVAIQWVVAIEGYSYLLTDGSTSAAVTAWSGTDWSQALGGLLSPQWGNGQEMKPWSTDLSLPTVRLCVQSDGSADTFGKAVFGRDAGLETELRTSMDADDTTATVAATASFASSGEIHVGTECMAYTGKTSGTFTGLTRGKYSPFTASGSTRYAHPHTVPTSAQIATNRKPRVTSLPRAWVGRWVGIWLHRVVGGVLDVKAQAQLVFAGRIVGTSYDDLGATWLELEDMRGAIRDCVLMRDQWKAKITEGVYLRAGYKVSVKCVYWNGTDAEIKAGNDLVVKSSPATDNEMQDGINTYEAIVSALNRWLANEVDADRINHYVGFALKTVDGQLRTNVAASYLASGQHQILIRFSGPEIPRMLGYGNGTKIIKFSFQGTTNAPGAGEEEFSPEVPFRRMLSSAFFGYGDGVAGWIPIEDTEGAWFDNSSYLPPGMRPTGSGQYGVVQFGNGSLAVVNGADIGSGKLYPMLSQAVTGLVTKLGPPVEIAGYLEQRMGDDDDTGDISVRQVAVINSTFAAGVMRLLASAEASTANWNGTYDVLPGQLGAAVPAQLTSSLYTDLTHLTESASTFPFVIEKPTRLWDVLAPSFLLRGATLMWKNQGLRVATWSIPTSSSALHTFNETNKAEPAGRQGSHRSVGREDDQFVANIIKVQHGRMLTGNGDDYTGTSTVVDVGAMDEVGQRAITVKARNETEDSVRALISVLGGFINLFALPMMVVRRSVALTHYENVAPGDHCLITDDNVRDPATGARGVTSKPGLIIRHRVDWGGAELRDGLPTTRGMVGEIDVLIFPSDRVLPYAPCAQVDHTQANGGYDSGTSTLTFKAHEHSESTDAVDVSHFASGDKVHIIEMDPATPSSPTSWLRTLTGVTAGSNTATFSGGTLTGWSSSKKYRMISDTWTNAVTSQRTKAYIADDSDGLIAATSAANEYGRNSNGAPSAAATADTDTVQVAIDESSFPYGASRPLDTGYERDLARIINNFVSYRSAPSLAMMSGKTGITGGGTVRRTTHILPIEMGPGVLPGLGVRKLWVAPMIKSTDGTSATCRISLCSMFPTGTSRDLSSTTEPEYLLQGRVETTSWTVTSTTYATQTEYGFSFKNLDREGSGWLVIELTSKCTLFGLPVLRAGPFAEG